MACIADTDSVDLSNTAGVLTADLKVSVDAFNPASVVADGLYVAGADGWLPIPATLAYSSASAPTYVATVSADLRSFIGPGAKVKLTQSGTVRYFVVVAITAGTITLYGGDSQVLANAAITLPYLGLRETPVDFPAIRTSTLPSVAYDGMRILFIADATNGVEWNLEYVAAASGSYKWRNLSGTPLYAAVATSETTSSVSYVGISTVLSLVSPVAGDYVAAHGCSFPTISGGGQNYATLDYNGTPADAEAVRWITGGPAYQTARTILLTIAAAVTVAQKYRVNSGAAGAFAERWISLLPRRVG